MAVVNGYCSTQDLRDHLSDPGTKMDEALLERAVNAASRAVDRYCGRRFWQDPEPAVRHYRAEDAIEIDVNDIATTTGLAVATDDDGDGVYENTWTLDEDYVLEPENADADGEAYAWWRLAAVGARRFPVPLTGRTLDSRGLRAVRDRRRRIQVTATFGWSQVPDDVEQATILKAAQLARRKDAPFGVAGFGDFGVVRIGRYDPDVVGLLHPFVRIGLLGV
ncbi:hypothetical protein [Nocardiopsis synnemataformans]|uniref:hypothetical protein n=1 Tax=Nocardiopsis synnemataformans TaxID=61305 RepID=UPI003EBE676F